MATPEKREQESRESDVTKFEEKIDDERERRHEVAREVVEPLEPRDGDSDDE